MKRPDAPPENPLHPPFDATVDARTVDPKTAPERATAEPTARWVVANRYEILGLLGSGGMGTVYRAHDRELDDVVALKMLKKQIAAAPGILDRFRREVKLARRVTHRNVARTFDIGEHAGAKFLTMEFIDGEMLGTMLQRRGRLRIAEVTSIGRDICAGLAAAHAAGVLHRDLKPANVVVARDGRAVITDFGIARALHLGASTQTAAGGIVGTPAYMAPEQLEGAPDLDARTDVYALGAMLFELLAGEVPWASLSPLQASLAKLQGPAPDLRALRPTLPDTIATLVARCMARQRSDRFASAVEVASALEGLDALRESSASLVPPSLQSSRHVVRTRLAVLLLVNQGSAGEDYLSHTLTEDLVDVLAAVPGLHVRPLVPGSPMPADIDAVVTGTVHLVGDRLRVVLRLVMQEDGFALWEGRFDRPIEELVAVADAAASAMADALTTKTLATPRSMPANPAAYDLYLRGRHVFLRGWYDAGGEALRLLADAHMLAPSDATIAATYARALARSYGTTAATEDVARLAKEIAEKALVLDPRRADARLALTAVHLYRGDGVGAAIELRRAFAAAPGDGDVQEMLGRLRAEVGPLAVAVEHLRAALVREPTSTEARLSLARAHALLGDAAECERTLGPTPADPSEQIPHLLTAARLAMWFRDPRRIAELLPSVEALSKNPDAKMLAAGLLRVGERGTLDAAEREYLARVFPSGSSTGQRLAAFHAQLRAEVFLACADRENAIEAIREADANGLLDLMWLEHCPLLDPLRGHRDLDPIRRSTTLRASRVSDVLDGK
jgi:serine/threonine protein kinase/tetratricopeptide (TPR) repeat protein